MGDLKDWADKQSPYIRLEDGESFVGEYVGHEFGVNRFDPKKKQVKYTFIKDGEEKSFESGAMGVAYQFDKIKEGSMVRISRKGDGPSTTYEVTQVVDKKGDVSKKEADSIAEELAG